MQRHILVPLALAMFFSVDAWAWDYDEHVYLSRDAYVLACNGLHDGLEPGRAPHFRIVCGDPATGGAETDAYAPSASQPSGGRTPRWALRYGQAVAIAGDHLDDPDEFFSALGGVRAVSRTNYYLLASVNSSHFNPESIQKWRRYHAAAVALALEASSLEASEQRIRFEQAIMMSAFANHFLGDSFAAGHMGYNRAASSAAASFAFHGDWNDRGRFMRNQRGEIWWCHGDGAVFDDDNKQKSAENRACSDLVVFATQRAVASVLKAFVYGRRSPADEDAVESAIPTFLYGRTLLTAHGAGFFEGPYLERFQAFEAKLRAAKDNEERRRVAEEHGAEFLQPIASIQQQAYKNASWNISTTVLFPAGTQDPAIFNIVGLSYRILGPVRLTPGIGLALGQMRALTSEVGLDIEVGRSLNGLLTHGPTAKARFVRTTPDLGPTYRASIELGPVVVTVEGGVSWNRFTPGTWTRGWSGGLGLGYVWDAGGGGPF